MGSSDIEIKLEPESPTRRPNQGPVTPSPAPGWREIAEYWVGYFDTPETVEEWGQLLDDIALERGIEVVAEFY